MWSFSNLFGNEDKSSEPAKAAEKNESKTTIVGSKPVQAEGKQGLLDFDNAMGTMNRALGGERRASEFEDRIGVLIPFLVPSRIHRKHASSAGPFDDTEARNRQVYTLLRGILQCVSPPPSEHDLEPQDSTGGMERMLGDVFVQAQVVT
ncbi:hypothetical protein AAMO2058_000707200 [Amorphochlora amoebiformis]